MSTLKRCLLFSIIYFQNQTGKEIKIEKKGDIILSSFLPSVPCRVLLPSCQIRKRSYSLCRLPCESVSRSVVSDSLRPHALQPARLLYPRHSPGKNTGLGCHSLLQGVFLTQGSNPGLLPCRWILSYQDSLPSEPPGKPSYDRESLACRGGGRTYLGKTLPRALPSHRS